MHGKLEPIDCPPLSEVTVSLPYTMDQVTGDGMAVLTVSFATTRELPGLAAGFTFAWDQFVLRPMPQPVASCLLYPMPKSIEPQLLRCTVL